MRDATHRRAAPTDGAAGPQQGRRRLRSRTGGFTLTELFVLMAMGALLTGLFLPQLSQDHSKLTQLACANNLKQWGMVFQMYAADYRGVVMIQSTVQTNVNQYWYSTAGLYAKYWSTNRVVTSESQARMMKARLCPAMELTTPLADSTIPGYCMIRPLPAVANFRGFNIKHARKPNQFLVMIDAEPTMPRAFIGANGDTFDAVLTVTNRHSGGANLLFCDGHVDWKPWADIETNLASWVSLSAP